MNHKTPFQVFEMGFFYFGHHNLIVNCREFIDDGASALMIT